MTSGFNLFYKQKLQEHKKHANLIQSPSSDSVFSQAALVAGASVIGNAANSLNDVLSQTGLTNGDIAGQPAL